MSLQNAVTKLAKILAKDLNKEGLKRYAAAQRRMIDNELKMGRKPTRFVLHLKAAELAMKELL